VFRVPLREASMAVSIATHQLSNLRMQDVPLEPAFIIRTPPGLVEADFAMSVLCFGQGRNHPTLIAHTEDGDSTALVAQEQIVCKKHRPCRGKRLRYKRFVKRIEAHIQANPVSFDLNKITLPPSLQANVKQQEKLRRRIERYHDWVKTSEVPQDARASIGHGQTCSE